MSDSTSDHDIAAAYLRRSLDVVERAVADKAFNAALLAIAQAIEASLRAGSKVMLAGNGGSAGDAQHIAGEFLSRFRFDRHPLPAIALTTDSSVLTAIGNDYGYEHVFERQVLGLGREGDVFLGISTSGTSPNVLRAAGAARERGIVTFGWTGARESSMRQACDLLFQAPSTKTSVAQQVHIVAAHILCGLVERAMFPAGV
jgi:D-sedoheptulose 7-phosphate isomerase